jgi:hypothetical protein
MSLPIVLGSYDQLLMFKLYLTITFFGKNIEQSQKQSPVFLTGPRFSLD